MYWALLLYPVKGLHGSIVVPSPQPLKKAFGVDNISHISPFELVVPVFQSSQHLPALG